MQATEMSGKLKTRLQKQLDKGTSSSKAKKGSRESVSLWTKKLFIEEFRESCAKDPSLAPAVVGRRPHFNLSQKQIGDILFAADEILEKVEEMGEAQAKKRTKLYTRPILVLEQILLKVFQEEVKKGE
ncbi:hypothetical protein FBU30_006392 [Linnemannia zychae]|nr:hypothetical protein FBU30_006392 [Linnemannia zychae]